MEQAPISISTLAASPFESSTDMNSNETVKVDVSPSSMIDAEADTAASITSPPVSPISNTTSSHLSSPQSNLTLSKSNIKDTMKSLDAAFTRSSEDVTSDYSSSTGDGSDNGQDDDEINALSTFDQQSLNNVTEEDSPRFVTEIEGSELPESLETPPSTWEGPSLSDMTDEQFRQVIYNSFCMVQEKEQEILLANEQRRKLLEENQKMIAINKSIIEEKEILLEEKQIENNALQAKYQRSLTQLRQQRMHRPKHLNPPRKIALTSSTELTGDTIYAEDGGDENWVDFEPTQSVSNNTTPRNSMISRRPNQTAAIRARSRQDTEKLATLEQLNAQLQVTFEDTTKEYKKHKRQFHKNSRTLEKEIKAVKDELERTRSKLSDLEEQNGRLIEAGRTFRSRRIMLKNQFPAPGSIPGTTMASLALEMQGDEMTIQEMLAEDNRIFEELRDRLQSLERNNKQLAHQKNESEKRNQQILQELSDMQRGQEQMLNKLCEFDDLQRDYNEQSAHIKELENTVEELQNNISNMSSRLSQVNSPLMSPTSPMPSFWGRDNGPIKAILQGGIPSSPMPLKSPRMKGQQPARPRRTLLSELESEIFRDFSFFGPPRGADQPIHIQTPKSPKALRDRRHDSESDTFSDAGGKVHGWRAGVQDMDMEEACESSNCIRKRRHRFRYDGSDTDGDDLHLADDSDIEHYQLQQRRSRQNSICEDDDCLSDCSDPHHHNYGSSTPCCCMYEDDYSDYSEGEEGWAHFEDYDASSFGYDKKRDGFYLGRRNRRGIFGMVANVFLIFRFFWRWCRFICYLSTALGIALYRGPDALLTDR